MKEEQQALVGDIVKTAEKIFNAMKPHVPIELLTVDITLAQLRILLILYVDGPSKMSSLANQLDVVLSTVTGTIDNLVKKNLVTRETEESDRRVVICQLTPEGRELTSRLWLMGLHEIEKLLEALDIGQLEKVVEVVNILLENVKKNN